MTGLPEVRQWLPKKDWKDQKCGTCEFFVPPTPDLMNLNAPSPPADQGLCKERPPHTYFMPIPTPQGLEITVKTAYPLIVRSNNACGQWKEKEKKCQSNLLGA